jgi:hypothetical protein
MEGQGGTHLPEEGWQFVQVGNGTLKLCKYLVPKNENAIPACGAFPTVAFAILLGIKYKSWYECIE